MKIGDGILSSQLRVQREYVLSPAVRGWRWPLFACLLLLAAMLRMNGAAADTMTRNPASCASQAGIGSKDWSTPDRATASDGRYATASLDGQITRYLWCNDYGFSIPTGSVINGIRINVERKVNNTRNGGALDSSMRVVKNGAVVGNDRASGNAYTTNDVVEPHGGANDLWGTTWTATDINASNFGTAFAAANPTSVGNSVSVSVDYVEVVVDFTPPLQVNSIARVNTDPTTNGSSVAWQITFNAAAYQVTKGDFALVTGPADNNLSPSTITGVSGSGTTYKVTATVGAAGYGTLGLILVDRDTITDVSGNPLGGAGTTGTGNGSFTGQTYAINRVFCTPPSNAPAGVSCVCDSFNRPALNPGSTIFGANWIASTSDTTGLAARIVNPGYLRLTDNTPSNAKAATVPGIFPAAGNYISVEFAQYAYGSNSAGADGMAVTLSDYSVSAVPGAFGGSLGYAQKGNPGSDCTTVGGCPGFAGGWLGVALDEYGNFQFQGEGRQGGATGMVPQSISARGSGSGMSGYRWLAGSASNLNPAIAPGSTTRPAPNYFQVVVDARAYTATSKTAIVQVNRSDAASGAYTPVFPSFDIYGVSPTQVAVPDNWQISFTGSTGGSTNIHEIGAVQACAQYVFQPGGGTASGFNAIDEGYGTPPNVAVQNYLTGHIYTKLMGVPFKLNVAAFQLPPNESQINTIYSSGTKNVTVNLVDNSDGACVLDNTQTNYCSAVCTGKAAVAGGSQTMSFAGAADKGQKQSASFTLNSAYRNLTAIITDPNNNKSYCSTDSFSVRPTGLAGVASSANNASSGGTPIFKAGADPFALTATTIGISGSPSLYKGMLKVDGKSITSSLPASGANIGNLTGTFAAATSGTGSSTATGTNFTYSEVGVIQLPGADPVANPTALRGIYDGVASATECASPVTAPQCDILRGASWTGVDSVSAKNDCVLDSYSNAKSGDGKYGCNFGLQAPLTVGRFTPSYFTLSGASLANRSDLACSPVSVFTYMNEPMLATFTLTAMNAGGVATVNYQGGTNATDLAKLNPVTPASFNLGALGTVSLTSRLGALSGKPSASWISGVARNVTLGFQFLRAAGPDGPFTPKFGIAPQDSDGITLLPTAYDLDIDLPSPATDHAQIGQTSIRFGRLKLSNAFGSEKLDLPVPLEAQYWNGAAFITNTDDSCSPVAKANVVIGNYAIPPKGSLNSTNMGLGQVSIKSLALPVTSPVTLGGGKATLTLSKPLVSGSADLAIKLGTAGISSDESCSSAPSFAPLSSTPGATGIPTGAGLDYLQSQWCGSDFTRDPRVNIRFGVYKNANQMIYMREMY
jgi:MSHA biogenesis protein MshQ